MDDDAQARFFVECARIAAEWRGDLGFGGQWWAVGKHLRECTCSTEAARELVANIFDGMQPRAEGGET